MKVTAFDADSKENGEIQYHKINGGSEFIDSVEVDMNNGNIFLVSNKGLDRETTESKHRNHTIQKCKKIAGQNTFQILLLNDANMIGEH